MNLWNARQLRCKTGDGNEHNGCSNGANAVNDGRRGGRKDAGGFSAQTELGKRRCGRYGVGRVGSSWCDDNIIVKQQREREREEKTEEGERRNREKEKALFEFFT